MSLLKGNASDQPEMSTAMLGELHSSEQMLRVTAMMPLYRKVSPNKVKNCGANNQSCGFSKDRSMN